MSNPVYKIFEDVEDRAKLLARSWENFYMEISQHLPETYQPKMNELSNNLEKALEKLLGELRNPTLTIATTGTTSSGKSTLVNFLCGAEIVPMAVSEMSAGVVTIEYSDQISLVIHETPGATWECGEWQGISEEEIYQRLEEVMMSYIDRREENPNINLACPQSAVTISYPFKFLEESNLELPRGTKIRIMDLPGLAYVGDEGNANVIRQCREALCIVTYNSEETDKQKVRNLLQEVVEQVKDLGGSPARMLFVLNKIDVFRKDKNWPYSEERFVKKTVDSIKSELIDRLKEYTEEIENLQDVKLSTWPALLALQMQSDNDNSSVQAGEKAQEHFYGMIKDILADLSRNVQKWEKHDRNRVAEALWKKSYAGEFFDNLNNHITEHFPQLVIPQVIKRFNEGVGNDVTEWVKQTTTVILNSSEDRYHKECEEIGRIRTSIEHFLEIHDRNLREPFEEIGKTIQQVLEQQPEDEDENDPVVYIEDTIIKLKYVEPYGSLGEKLYPLYGWIRELRQGINQVLEAVAESLEKGKVNLESTNLKKANYLNVNLLERNLNRLVDLGYTASVAKNGKNKEARTENEKKELKKLNEELNELAIHLNLVLEDVVNQISNQELNRMYQAVVELFSCHLSYLEKGSNDIAPNIAIKFPDSQISKVDGQLKFTFNFKAGFPITEGTWKESVQKAVEKRIWWTLWLVKSTFYETEYKTRSSDNAEIPSVENLLEGWIIQSKQAEVENVKQIAHWLLDQIDCLKKNVSQVQSDIIDRYQSRLDKARQEVTIDYEKEKNIWEPMKQKAQKLAEEFYSLAKILSKES
ncbi:MAG: GTPase [Okeania sp. SIO3B5]|uniref:dynamin family protein n=1 Tax=Okeania sp. SIO3B5 TaxID=2607811 RepID=UPI0014007AEC|nr:dynamin family protein [Okeania sp. SIO3B5]NEO57606.1 GTPase [Okeania sp. SIO3B5]